MASEQQGDENTSSGSMENVMNEEGLEEGIGRKFNESINGEGMLEDKLNINEVDDEDLLRIPGIKKEVAEKIVEYRKDKGKFKDFEDLKKVGLDKDVIEILKKWVDVK